MQPELSASAFYSGLSLGLVFHLDCSRPSLYLCFAIFFVPLSWMGLESKLWGALLQFFRLKQVGQFGVKRFKRDGYGCILEPKNGRYYGEGITQQFENVESVSKPLENFCIALNLCDSSRMMDPTVNPLTAKFCQLQADIFGNF